MVTIPEQSGWYWVKDDELIGNNQWVLVALRVDGDSLSRGMPVATLFTPEEEIEQWKFCWDGEDWVGIDDQTVNLGCFKPVEWVRRLPPTPLEERIATLSRELDQACEDRDELRSMLCIARVNACTQHQMTLRKFAALCGASPTRVSRWTASDTDEQPDIVCHR